MKKDYVTTVVVVNLSLSQLTQIIKSSPTKKRRRGSTLYTITRLLGFQYLYENLTNEY